LALNFVLPTCFLIVSPLCVAWIGKYGYDPRCRNWYHRGREASGVNRSFVYVTPPYLFASSQEIYAQSASSTLVDPRNGKHVGQTLIDYLSQSIIDSLDSKNFAVGDRGFPILITVESDNFGADTVIGPGQKNKAQPIAELVLPYDPPCQGAACEEGFYAIVKKMKEGQTGTETFQRRTKDGGMETIYISFAPVVVKSLAPVNSSDFSRGVLKSDYLFYSLAFAVRESSMMEPFNDLEYDIDVWFYITFLVLCVTIFLSTCFVFYISNVIAVSMTEPMLYLLEVVRHINR
jgi:hypothetical protein